MEKVLKNMPRNGPDLNGNNREPPGKRKNGTKALRKDKVITKDGRVFYPCRFCNKVFHVKNERTKHVRKCPAKSYILSVDAGRNTRVTAAVQKQTKESDKTSPPPIKLTIRRSPSENGKPPKFTVSSSLVLKEKNNDEFSKIAKRLENNSVIMIKQSVTCNNLNSSFKLKSTEILDKKTSASTKSTKNIINKETFTSTDNNHITNNTTITNSGASNDDSTSSSTNIAADAIKTTDITGNSNLPVNESPTTTSSDDEGGSSPTNDKTCKKCKKEFKTQLDMLRHVRKCNAFPKIVMALSEIKKFYDINDRNACPICKKPLKTNFKSAFIKHLLTHTKEFEYSCKVCGKLFRRSDHMKAHERRHVN